MWTPGPPSCDVVESMLAVLSVRNYNPEGPGTQYLRFQSPATINSMVFGGARFLSAIMPLITHSRGPRSLHSLIGIQSCAFKGWLHVYHVDLSLQPPMHLHGGPYGLYYMLLYAKLAYLQRGFNEKPQALCRGSWSILSLPYMPPLGRLERTKPIMLGSIADAFWGYLKS